MPATKDLAGKKFGKLTVVERLKKDHHGAWLWRCVCECGGETIRSSGSLRRAKGCGCLQHVTPVIALGREVHGMTGSPEHETWLAIKHRCGHFPRTKGNPIYIRRGIKVCDRWLNSFTAFFKDMGPRPSQHHSIERVDNDSGYEPGNCRWATIAEQSNNRSNTLRFTLNGVEKPLAVWCRELGVNRHSVWGRIKSGMSFEDAIAVPQREAELITVAGISKTIPEWGQMIGVTVTSAYRLHRQGKLAERVLMALSSNRTGGDALRFPCERR